MRRIGKKASWRNTGRLARAAAKAAGGAMVMDALESRTMLCFTGTAIGPGTPAVYSLNGLSGDPYIYQNMGPHGPALGAVPTSPLSSVPALSSKPDAAATVDVDALVIRTAMADLV